MKKFEELVTIAFSAIMVTFSSCSKNDDIIEDIATSTNKNAQVILKSAVHEFLPFYNVSREKADGTESNYVFSENSTYIYVYAKQDGKLIDCGKCTFTNSSDRKSATCLYNEKGLLDTSKLRTVYFSQQALVERNEAYYYRRSLKRNAGYSSIAMANITHDGQTIDCEADGVREIAKIRNNSSKEISFKLKGFEAAELWYYAEALVSMDDHSVIEGKTVTKDIESDPITIAPEFLTNKYVYVTSIYAPTGKKVNNATLVAEIDGREVRTTNTLSSDLSLEPGKTYTYVLEWNGSELRFAYDYEPLDESISDRGRIVHRESVSSLYSPLYPIISYDLTNMLGKSAFNETVTTQRVYAKRDGWWIYCGTADIAMALDNKSLTCTYNQKGLINTSLPHEVAISGATKYIIDNELCDRKALSRGWSFNSSATGTLVVNGETLQSQNIGTCERSFIINTTDQPINFRHKGFEAENYWYYGDAFITEKDHQVLSGTKIETDSCSDVFTVNPLSTDTWRYLYSYYVPTGQKIKDATLVAEIDGREVRTTNTLSSDLDIEYGESYYYVLRWDGENLVFVDDEQGNAPIRATLRRGKPMPVDRRYTLKPDMSTVCE